MKKKLTNCIYLEDEAVDVMGFKIYGSPWYDCKTILLTFNRLLVPIVQ